MNADEGQPVPETGNDEQCSLPTWLTAEAASDNASQDDLDDESFVEQYCPEGECQGEDPKDDEEADDAREEPPPTERLDYAPSRHELFQLARYWVRANLSFTVNWYLFGFTGGYESRLAATSGDRLHRIAELIGDDAVQTAVKQIEGEYRYSLGDRIWDIYTNGTRAEVAAIRAEIHEMERQCVGFAPPAVPQGLLPADVGASDAPQRPGGTSGRTVSPQDFRRSSRSRSAGCGRNSRTSGKRRASRERIQERHIQIAGIYPCRLFDPNVPAAGRGKHEQKEERAMATIMIRCGDHKQAPASMVCIHLAKGLSKHWHGDMMDGNEVAEAWLCPECEPHPWDLGLADWVLVCMHCIRRMQKEAGTTVTLHDCG